MRDNLYRALASVYGDTDNDFVWFLNEQLVERILSGNPAVPYEHSELSGIIQEFWSGEVLADRAATKVMGVLYG